MSEKSSVDSKDHEKDTKKSEKMETPGVCQKISDKYTQLTKSFQKCFEAYTGHDPKCISSFDNFIKFMHKPTDAAALGIGRMLFGKFLSLTFNDFSDSEPRNFRP